MRTGLESVVLNSFAIENILRIMQRLLIDSVVHIYTRVSNHVYNIAGKFV